MAFQSIIEYQLPPEWANRKEFRGRIPVADWHDLMAFVERALISPQVKGARSAEDRVYLRDEIIAAGMMWVCRRNVRVRTAFTSDWASKQCRWRPIVITMPLGVYDEMERRLNSGVSGREQRLTGTARAQARDGLLTVAVQGMLKRHKEREQWLGVLANLLCEVGKPWR
jgi:hypothetical protein